MPSDPSPATGAEHVGLGVLLGLLHDADSRPARAIRATYRIWRHEGRLRDAFHADAEGRHPGHATTRLRAAGPANPQPEEREETIAFWQQDKRSASNITAGRETATIQWLTARCGGPG
jgi:hypothetical protein